MEGLSSDAAQALGFCDPCQLFWSPLTGHSLSFAFLTFVSKFHVTGSELLADASAKLRRDSSFREGRGGHALICASHRVTEAAGLAQSAAA